MDETMRSLALLGLAFLACAALTGCGYEKGFEYMTDAKLVPSNGSAVSGTVVMGYGMEVRTFRIRVKVEGLDRSASYEVRLLDATSCNPDALAKARRIDAPGGDPGRTAEAWGFEKHPAGLSADAFGRAAHEFRLSPPTAPSIYGSVPDKYPTVVIGMTPAHPSSGFNVVACGVISQIPTNRRPHM